MESYTIKDVLLTTKEVELIGKKKFTVAAFDLEHKVFLVNIAALSVDFGDEVHPSKKAQIAHLKADKAPTKVLSRYADFPDVFLLKLAAKLRKHMRINNYIIELVDD